MDGPSRGAGFNLVELVVAMAIGVVVAGLTTPDLLRLSSALRVRIAAADVASALRTARATAIREGVHAAVKFRSEQDGAVSYRLYRDGDGDGVQNADIDSGVDPPVGPARRIRHLGRRVKFGFPSGRPPRDPANPYRVLGKLEDPIRFNRSDLASFNPLGGSTPGSVYLTDGRHHLSAVRLYGMTGKVQVLDYDRVAERWS